jgi:murein DD-endopeptidase MepM/ murein hydrolase activator NlpD
MGRIKISLRKFVALCFMLVIFFAVFSKISADDEEWEVTCKGSTGEQIEDQTTSRIRSVFESYYEEALDENSNELGGSDYCFASQFDSAEEMWKFEACNYIVGLKYRQRVFPGADGECLSFDEFVDSYRGDIDLATQTNQEAQESNIYERDHFLPPVEYSISGFENNEPIWWGDTIREGHPAWDVIAFPEDTYHAVADGECIFAGDVRDENNTHFIKKFGLDGNISNGGYGNVVVTKHEVIEYLDSRQVDEGERQVFSIYVIGAHLSDESIPLTILDCHKKEEETILVRKGDVLGNIGSTGLSTSSHLHFEIRKKLKKDPENRLPYTYIGEPGECDENYCDGRCIITEEKCKWGDAAKVIKYLHDNQSEAVYNQDFSDSQDFYDVPIGSLTARDNVGFRRSAQLGESCNVHSDCANEGIVCDGGRCVNGNPNAFVYFSENFDPIERGIITKEKLNERCYTAAKWDAPDGKPCYRGVTKEFFHYLNNICEKGLIDNCLYQSEFKPGTKLIIKYGYRDTELQRVLNAQSPAGAASPGYSQHQSGNAIDIFFTPDPGQYTDFNYINFRKCLVNGTDNWIIHPLEWDTPHFYYCGDHGCDEDAPLYASDNQDVDHDNRSRVLAINIEEDLKADLSNNFIRKIQASESSAQTSIQNITPGTYAVFQDNEQVSEVDIAVDADEVKVRFYNDKNANNVKDTNEEYIDDATNIKLEKKSDVIEYNLNSGWNLINLPLVVYNENDQEITMASQLAHHLNNLNILQDIHIVHLAKYENGRFEMYSTRTSELDNGTEFAEDFLLVPGQALYLFNAIDTARVKLKGQKFDSEVSLQLSNGWNMVGIMATKQDQYTAEELLSELDNQAVAADSVSQFENGIYQTVIKPLDENLLYGNDFNIVEKRGYFIRVNSQDSDNIFVP